ELYLALAALRVKDKPSREQAEVVAALLERTRRNPVAASTRLGAMHLLAWAETALGRFASAQARLEEALESAGDNADLRGRLLDTLGTARRRSRSMLDARTCYQESLAIKQQHQELVGLEMTRQNLGWCSLASGDFSD